MSSSKLSAISRRLTTLLCCTGIAMASQSVGAEPQHLLAIGAQTQIGRYSDLAAGPTVGQQDLLSVTRSITIPRDINSVGGALRWLLRDSGYRLADESVLSEEALAMLELPLPNAHRYFEPMPLKAVIGLLVGPAFHLIQDPLHRLVAFERCINVSNPTSTGGAH
ncbi:MAG: pili assembly chaperone [Pseudomonadales bacterium]|nr:pili assembly chaperone [Pseudomonadales bacterium]